MAFRAGGMNIGDFLGGLRNNISGLQQGMPEAPGPAMSVGPRPGGVSQPVTGMNRPMMGANTPPRRPNAPVQGGVLMNAFRGARRF